MEYATREQAQQAVNTLSNQNLMGRLVYVREVNPPDLRLPSYLCLFCQLPNPKIIARIAKRNRVLPDHLQAVEGTKEDQAVAALALEVMEVQALHLPAEVVKYSLTTFVIP